VIYVSKHQLDQVEYLLQQSIQGNHILFDTESVRRILKISNDKPDSFKVEDLIESLILEPTIERKKEFLRNLDRRTYACVVRTYFNIVENKLQEKYKVCH